jgi:hypothetical protein
MVSDSFKERSTKDLTQNTKDIVSDSSKQKMTKEFSEKTASDSYDSSKQISTKDSKNKGITRFFSMVLSPTVKYTYCNSIENSFKEKEAVKRPTFLAM